MIKLLDGSKVTLFDYLYLLCIIIYAGMASAFVREFGDIRTVGNAIPLFFTFIFILNKHINFNRHFFYVVAVFTIYSLLVIFSTGSGFGRSMWGYSRWMIYILVAYTICKGYGRRFFVLAETILFHLAIISIICWVILLIIPAPFTQFISSFSLPAFNDDDRFTSANVLFYTVILSSVTQGSGEWYLLIRNSGFAWEPGAFSCFLLIGICFNIFRKNFSFSDNISLVVFLIALASTQSTTGYYTFMAVVALWLVNNHKARWLLVLLPLFIGVISLPFMSDKFSYELEGLSDATFNNADSNSSFDRLLSLQVLWGEFLEHPILGYGFAESELEQNSIRTWSGIGRLLSQYGIIMSILFLIFLWKSSRFCARLFQSRSEYVIFVAILGSMISYMLWTQPLFMAIWMSCLFIDYSTKTTFLCYQK